MRRSLCLIPLLVASLITPLWAQSPPSDAEQAQLQQMRAAAARQGISLTPEMEAQALKKLREVQANLLGTQLALTGMTPSQNAKGNPPELPMAPTGVAPAAGQAAMHDRTPPVDSGASATTDGGTYVYLAPADNDPSLESIGCGVRLGFRKVITGTFLGQNGIWATVEPQDTDTAFVTVMRGDTSYQYGTGVRTRATMSIETSATACKLGLRLLDETPFKSGPLKLWKAPDFTAAGVLENTPRFYYRPSVTAPYPPNALLANFDRLAVKGCNGVGYALSRNLNGEGNGKNTYCLKLGNGEYAPAVVECFPYRNGAQCTALTVLPARREGKVFDATAAGSQFKAALEAIVND